MRGFILANVRLDVQHVQRTLLTEVITIVIENYVQWEGRNKIKLIIYVFRIMISFHLVINVMLIFYASLPISQIVKLLFSLVLLTQPFPSQFTSYCHCINK